MDKLLYKFFIPTSYFEHPEALRQAKINVLFYLINAIMLFLYGHKGFDLGFPPFSYATIAFGLISVSLVFLIKWEVSISICASIFTFFGACYSSFLTYYSGGIDSAPILSLALAPLFYLFLSNNERRTVFWMILTILITLGFYFYEKEIKVLPIAIDKTKVFEYYLTSIVGEFISIFILIMIFHNFKNRAVNSLIEINENLKKTQAQLIQSEKLASLGELTAGIAHEIQNPLNFVNNFSEVSNELIQELKVEKLKVNSERDEKLEDELLNDISSNLEKINHHGKRAGDIVKGMLQHSRTSSGVKEPTDINALCDEYLRLSYHGYRAKDKSFNAKFETEFDASLPKVNVVPHDIGRVVLNLINNAFYAVSEKQKEESRKTDSNYEPTVLVTTKSLGNKIEICVKDNGNGIPENIKEKIFQPFFTTKPTGQGTGLGLSLSYDIVKAHGGEIKVETKENEGTAFTIQIPLS